MILKMILPIAFQYRRVVNSGDGTVLGYQPRIPTASGGRGAIVYICRAGNITPFRRKADEAVEERFPAPGCPARVRATNR